MAAKKIATASISQLEQEIARVGAKLDQARQKKVKEAQKAADQANKSMAAANKKLKTLRSKKMAAGKVKAKTPASEKRLQTAIAALAAQQAEVDVARQMLESAKNELAEIQTAQKAADMRAREIDKATKAVSKKLKKKAGASAKSKRTKKTAAKKATATTTGASKKTASKKAAAKKTTAKKAATKKTAPKKTAAKKATTKKATTKKTAAKKAATKKAPAKKTSASVTTQGIAKVAAKKASTKKPVSRKLPPESGASSASNPDAAPASTALAQSPASLTEPKTPRAEPVGGATTSTVKSPGQSKTHIADHGTTPMIEPRETKLPRPEPVSDTPSPGSLFDKDFYESDDKF